MLIKPIMNYGSEIWNFAITDNNNNLEMFHHKFYKFTLEVSTNATNFAVYGELGHAPLSICRKVQVAKYWQRICNENEDLPIYLRKAYLLAKSENFKWYTNIMDIFKSFGSDKLNEYLTINEIKQHLMNTFICE